MMMLSSAILYYTDCCMGNHIGHNFDPSDGFENIMPVLLSLQSYKRKWLRLFFLIPMWQALEETLGYFAECLISKL